MKAAHRARAGVVTIAAPWEPGKDGCFCSQRKDAAGRLAAKSKKESWEFILFKLAFFCVGLVVSEVVTGSGRNRIARSNLQPA